MKIKFNINDSHDHLNLVRKNKKAFKIKKNIYAIESIYFSKVTLEFYVFQDDFSFIREIKQFTNDTIFDCEATEEDASFIFTKHFLGIGRLYISKVVIFYPSEKKKFSIKNFQNI